MADQGQMLQLCTACLEELTVQGSEVEESEEADLCEEKRELRVWLKI
jgi:hypothetical protein